ncbi:hypothetical protein SESBI_41443 [Sesbania bispinosa]|nr:hypothetical protein SESBI_41443 [Sesbania bispinosa]
MMNGYSKINTHSAHKSSRSIDFSDFFSFPQTPKPSTSSRNTAPIAEEPNKTQNSGNGERFGVILGRSGSVSSSASGGFQATMKRAFSMRRSSSVSERYCRIHDQYVAIASDDIDVDDVIGTRRSINKKNSGGGGKILKACKRLLGL